MAYDRVFRVRCSVRDLATYQAAAAEQRLSASAWARNILSRASRGPVDVQSDPLMRRVVVVFEPLLDEVPELADQLLRLAAIALSHQEHSAHLVEALRRIHGAPARDTSAAPRRREPPADAGPYDDPPVP